MNIALLRESEGSFDESYVGAVLKTLLKIIQRLHRAHVCHCDIKPENLLYQIPTKQLSLIDFGCTIRVQDDQIYDAKNGTLFYIAPEKLKGNYSGIVCKKSDIWSIGVLAYELVTGKRLFYGDNTEAICNKIQRNEWHWPVNIQTQTFTLPSLLAQQFIQVCFFFF